MTIYAIPTVPGEPYYSLRTTLDGRDYNLSFSWNEREERWYMAIADEADVQLVAGLKLVCNWPLLRFYHANPALPPGELAVVALQNDVAPPGLFDLGIGLRCELEYAAAT